MHIGMSHTRFYYYHYYYYENLIFAAIARKSTAL